MLFRVGTLGGLDWFDPQTDTITHVQQDEAMT
jgi:hypothetical protein